MGTLDLIEDNIMKLIALRKDVLVKLAGQHVLLRSLPTMVKDKRVLASERKGNKFETFRKRTPRAVRRAVRLEKKEDRTVGLIIEAIDKITPLITEPFFTQLGEIRTNMLIYKNHMINELSKRGNLDQLLTSHPTLHGVEELIAEKIDQVLKNVINPYIEVLRHLDAFCNQKNAIREAKRQLITLTIPMAAFLVNNGIHPNAIIADSSTMFQVMGEKRDHKKELVYMTTPNNARKYFPSQVTRETAKGARYVDGAKTISTLRYFGFVEENVKPTPAERDFIIRFWKTTGKYQRSTSGERSDFLSKKAADLAILVLAWRLASNNQVVAILTNDGDIIQTINKIKSARNRNNNQRIIARRIKCATFGRNPDLRPRELRVA
ncbi:hypothetical protein HOA92_03420 [archaeon]|jgi:hypothetical protein|nr:hypothetical protein [archaeon]MBT6762061.1 hypothetical protein [archaeon]